MPPRRAAFVALLAALLVVLGLAAPASASSSTLRGLANDARAAAGLDPLAGSSALDAVALSWAKVMDRDDELKHRPDLSAGVPAGWTSLGENVAMGYSTPAAMHAGWMASPGHKANILGDFTHVGVAFYSGANGTWGVQVFARYPGSAAVEPRSASPEAEPRDSGGTDSTSRSQSGSTSDRAEESPRESSSPPKPKPTPTAPADTAEPTPVAGDDGDSPPSAESEPVTEATSAAALPGPWLAALIATAAIMIAATIAAALSRRSRRRGRPRHSAGRGAEA